MAVLDKSDTDVKLLEVFKRAGVLDGSSLVLSCLIGFLGCFQLVELFLDDVVFNFLEKQRGLSQLVTSLQQIGSPQLVPFEGVHVQHLTQFLAGERQERLECDSQISRQLQTDVQNGLTAFLVGLPDLPGFALCDIAIADAGQVHGFELCIAELELVKQGFHLLLHVLEFLQSLAVDILQFSASRNDAVPILLGQLQGTVDEVAIDGNQFVVVAVLEILPCEVVVLGFRGIGCQHIS